jgi:hypothetical protein
MASTTTPWFDEQLPGEWVFLVTEDGLFLEDEDGNLLVSEESEGTTWTDE